MRTIATFLDAPSAYLAASILEAEGIPYAIQDEHTVGVDWLAAQALGGVKLRVPEEHAARAAELVYADHSAEVDDPDPLRCPACGSLDVLRSRSRRRAGALGLLLGGIPLLALWSRHRCRSCRHRWPAT